MSLNVHIVVYRFVSQITFYDSTFMAIFQPLYSYSYANSLYCIFQFANISKNCPLMKPHNEKSKSLQIIICDMAEPQHVGNSDIFSEYSKVNLPTTQPDPSTRISNITHNPLFVNPLSPHLKILLQICCVSRHLQNIFSSLPNANGGFSLFCKV